MNNKNKVRIFLDLLMIIVFALLYNKMVIWGLAFHEIAGLAIGAVFIVHIILSWTWVKQMTLHLFNQAIAFKSRIVYLVDWLVLLSMSYVLASGILISKIIFPNLSVGDPRYFTRTHISIAYLTLLLIGIHLGLHWDWVMRTFNRLFKITRINQYGKTAVIILVIAVFALGSYKIYSINYFARLPIISGLVRQDQGHLSLVTGNQCRNFENRTGQYGMSATGAEGMRTHQQSTGHFQYAGPGFPIVNPRNVVATYLSIIGVFAIVTFYIEKLRTRKRISTSRT